MPGIIFFTVFCRKNQGHLISKNLNLNICANSSSIYFDYKLNPDCAMYSYSNANVPFKNNVNVKCNASSKTQKVNVSDEKKSNISTKGKDKKHMCTSKIVSNISCGECTCKILFEQKYITCKNRSLDFHIDCTDSSVDSCIDWYCNLCFTRICNDELPFGESFIDLNCKLQKGLKIAHLNICSIINKLDYLDILLHDNNIDVFCISETWTESNIDDSELMICGYNFCRLDRSNEMTHGGVLCYVKENLSFKQIF